MIDLRLLHCAQTLARHRNFARAAEALSMSQPTLSRCIAALERSVGVRLFDRDRRSVEPTAYGRLLLGRGAALLSEEAELRREIQLLAGLEVGALAVGAAPFPAEISVAAAAGRLLGTNPGLQVEVVTADPTEIPESTRSGRFDLGIVDLRMLEGDKQLDIEPLPRHPIFIAVRPGHPLAGRSGLRAAEIFRYPVAATRFLGAVGAALSAAGAVGVSDGHTGTFAPPITVDSLALAPWTPATASADPASRALVQLDFHQPWMQTNYGFAYMRGRSLSPAAQAFMALVREVEAETAAAEARRAGE